MTYAKTFLISLATFICINAIFFLIGYALIIGGIENFAYKLKEDPSYILEVFFGPIYSGTGPEGVLTAAVWYYLYVKIEPGPIILKIGYIVAPLLAATLSGQFGENEKEKIAGWFLTVLIAMLITIIWVPIDLAYIFSDEFAREFILIRVGSSLIMGFFYSFFALIVPERGKITV